MWTISIICAILSIFVDKIIKIIIVIVTVGIDIKGIKIIAWFLLVVRE